MIPSADLPIVVIGGGPAGLMAAEVMAQSGLKVHLYDAMPSVGRKFLLAGKGGLNLTHAEPWLQFATRYSVGDEITAAQRGNATAGHEAVPMAAPAAPTSAPSTEPMTHTTHPTEWLAHCSPDAVRAWAKGLGIETFVGSSGRVFPAEMKAAPLLRAWLHRLRGLGVQFHMRHRWLGWTPEGALRFATHQWHPATPVMSLAGLPHPAVNASGQPENKAQTSAASSTSPTPEHQQVQAAAVLLCVGGGSWSRLGSDGAWIPLLTARGIPVAPLKPSNCGFDIGWSAHMQNRFAGQPVKSIALRFTDASGNMQQRRGECLITATGIEGSLIYALSANLRRTLEAQGPLMIYLDLLPDRTEQQVWEAVSHPRAARSLSRHLQSQLNLKGVKVALLYEVLSSTQIQQPAILARTIKALPLTLQTTRPIDEAISTAGGVKLTALNRSLMLRDLPGVFCAGEMLDWEAPTGGYLLTACLASGVVAGQGVIRYLQRQPSH